MRTPLPHPQSLLDVLEEPIESSGRYLEMNKQFHGRDGDKAAKDEWEVEIILQRFTLSFDAVATIHLYQHTRTLD